MTAVPYTYSARPNPAARDRQRAECEALARALGHDVTGMYEDESSDRSALTWQMPQRERSPNCLSAVLTGSAERSTRHRATWTPSSKRA